MHNIKAAFGYKTRKIPGSKISNPKQNNFTFEYID